MRKRMLIGPAVLVLLAGYGAAAQPSQSAPPQDSPAAQTPSAPSVADAARKAREAKKSDTKAPKVIDNDSLPGSSDINVVGSEPASPADAGGAAAAAPSKKMNLAQQEQMWRALFAKARAKEARDEAELGVLQRELSRLQLVYYPNDPLKQLQQSVTLADVNNQQKKIEKKQSDINADKAAISDLDDALRRADGDPGWAR